MATNTSSICTNEGRPSVSPLFTAKTLRCRGRRGIDPQSGRALVVLSHAIEYLTDEIIFGGGSFTANRGQVEAIQLLMALNREIYFACPEVPTFWQWLRSGLRRLAERTRP